MYKKLINIRSIISTGIFLCLIMPKLNIIDISGYVHGIRYDDLFLLFCSIYLLYNNKLSLNMFPNKSYYFAFYIFILWYGLLSFYNTNIFSIILPLRWIEYSVFYIILLHTKISIKFIRNIIISYVILNLIVAILQYNKIIGGIYTHKYDLLVSGRIPGLTGGSWELPAVLAMLVSASIMDDYYRKNKIMLVSIIIMSSLMVYLAGTRSGMVVYFLGIGLALIGKYRINITSIIMICIVGYLFLKQDRMSDFITSINLPVSMQMRIDTWNKFYTQMDYINYLFGKGIGFSGLYVDGMFVKLFFDMGILGVIIFFLYYIKLLYKYKILGLIILLYCITIDFFTASKLMFGMYLSIYYIKQQEIQVKNRNIDYFYRLSLYHRHRYIS